jgi:hypothetical protein
MRREGYHVNRLTDSGEDISLTRRSSFTLKKIPGTNFCCRMSSPQSHSAVLRQLKRKSSDLIGILTRDLPACSIVPPPTKLLRIKFFFFLFLQLIWIATYALFPFRSDSEIINAQGMGD